MIDFEKIAGDGLSQEGAALIKNYLLGGLALGGSGALVTSFINYLNHIRKPEYLSSEDDDTIYVYRRNQGRMTKKSGKDENIESTFGERGLAFAGGLGATFAGYMLVRNLYAKLRAAQAQQELDKAQRIFLDEQGYDIAKKASHDKSAGKGNAPLSAWDTATGGLVATPLVLALATGIATHMMLDHKYPVKAKTEVKGPKKIKIVDAPLEDRESRDQDEYLKLASHEVEDEAKELIIRTALLNPVENSDLLDVCNACANGRHEELKKAAQAIGFLPALSLVKGAAAHEPAPLNKHLAIGWMAKDAYMNKSIALMAAGEFVEQYPMLYKQACILPRDVQENLFKAAVCLNRAIRFQQSQELGIAFPDTLEKSAASDAGTGDYLSRLLTRVNQVSTLNNAEPVTDGDDRESTETSGTMAGIHDPDSPSRPTHSKKMSFINSSKTARRNANDLPTDAIDQFLAGSPAPSQQPNSPATGV